MPFDQMYRSEPDVFTNVIVFIYDGVYREVPTRAVNSAVEDLFYSVFSARGRVKNSVRPAMSARCKVGRADYRLQLFLQGLHEFLLKHADLLVPRGASFRPHSAGAGWGRAVAKTQREQDELLAKYPGRHALLIAISSHWAQGEEASAERNCRTRQRTLVADVTAFIRRHMRPPHPIGKLRTQAERALAARVEKVEANGGFTALPLAKLEEMCRTVGGLSQLPRCHTERRQRRLRYAAAVAALHDGRRERAAAKQAVCGDDDAADSD